MIREDAHRHLWPGVPLALASAALFGASTPLAKLLIGAIEPWMLAGLLYLGAGAGLCVYRLLRLQGGDKGEAPLRKVDAPWLLLVILSGGITGPVLLMLGLARTDASSAALLLNLEGLATMLIAWLVFYENVDRRILLGAMAILCGAVVISWQGAGLAGFGWGTLLIAGACVCWGIDNNLTRKLSSADPVQIVTIKGFVAGTVNIALAALQGAAMPSLVAIALAGIVGLLGYGISIVFYVLALRHLGTARCGAYFSTAPFIGAALAILLFHDPVTLRLVAAGGLMLWGVWLHVTEGHGHWHEHEEVTHEHAHRHDEHHQHEHGPGDHPAGEVHVHVHTHSRLGHEHPHFPDLHHRHKHELPK